MKVLHIISSMGVFSGGPALSTLLTVKGERDLGINSMILTYNVNKKGDQLIENASFIHLISPFGYERFAYSFALHKKLMEEKVDLYHVHGIWQYPSICTFFLARKQRIPYVVTLRGMLYPQCFEKSSALKRFSFFLYLKSALQHAACLHATCIEEMEHLRNLNILSPIAVIPNPIFEEKDNCGIITFEKVRIGYLGRIHPRKRIERLLYVNDKLRDLNFQLIIIGEGDSDYMDFLKKEVDRLKLRNVIFTGFLTGKEKDQILNTLSYLIVPSDFENFGNIITEALIKGIPVIASKGTPWQELNIYHCGWWVDNDVDTLAVTIRKALELSEEERIAMGERGRELVKENYSVEMVGKKMKELYKWILYGGQKPEFVYLK